MSDREGGSGFGAFVLGIAVGAVVGFLFAPEAGDDTRRKLGKRLRNLRDVLPCISVDFFDVGRNHAHFTELSMNVRRGK